MQTTEQTYCAIIVSKLRSDGWQVYQEVETRVGVTDIVAVRNGIRWAIEVKTSMNLGLMDQARANAAYFHFSSLAVPAPKGGCEKRSWRFAEECGQVFGFGVLSLHVNSHEMQQMRVRSRGRLNRKPLAVTLHEEQKTQVAAGSNRGGHWTPFKSTVRSLEWAAQHTPGIRLKDAMARIDHHYSSEPSATGSIAHYIRAGIIKSLRLVNGKLYLAEQPEPVPLFT